MWYQLKQGLEKYEAEHPAPVSAENAEILEKVRTLRKFYLLWCIDQSMFCVINVHAYLMYIHYVVRTTFFSTKSVMPCHCMPFPTAG